MPYCLIYDCASEEIAELIETDGVSLDEQLVLVLTDLPNNARWESGRSVAEYDQLATDDITAMSMLCRQLMKFGSQWHAICFDVQFSKRIQVVQEA